VPGSAFGLGALVLFAVFTLNAIEAEFKTSSASTAGSERPPAAVSGPSNFWSITFGMLIGLVLSALIVGALIMPPAYLGMWLMSKEPLGLRIERALHPGEQWVALAGKERDASEAVKRSSAELVELRTRLGSAEAALAKAQDELGKATSNTVRGIRIAEKSGSRHANGTVYIGVKFSYEGHCYMSASSDKVDAIEKDLQPGEAVSLISSTGKYRVILTSLDGRSCTFDLVKD
jgi:hypothetical protein